MSHDWQDNTWENPFWKGSTYPSSSSNPPKSVEVMFKDGKIKLLTCPSCARGMFNLVSKWRHVIPDDKLD